MKGFGIYIQNDLLEPKHHKAMGGSIWLYLWCIDKMTSIDESGVGKVLGGKPIKFEELTDYLDISQRTYTRYISVLQKAGYIFATRTPYGYVIKVTKAKKVFNKRYAKNDERYAKIVQEIRQVGRNKEDKSKTSQKTICETKVSARGELKNNNEKDMWNTQSDDFADDISIDLDGDGTMEEKKPQTRKYPNAPAVRKIFQEVLGKQPANWKVNKNQLMACENLYTERGLKAIRNALQFAKENKDQEFCPIISSPHDLDGKWTKLGEYKKKQT